MSIFEKGIAWTLYKHMEAQFIDYLDYVPYTTDNEKVYSPRLIGMLLQICGYIDSVFKAMAEYHAFEKDAFCREIIRRELKHEQTKKDLMQEPRSTALLESEKETKGLPAMSLYRKAFEKLYSLSSNNGSHLIAKVGWEEPRTQTNQMPFRSFSLPDEEETDPVWWGNYNAVKHTWHRSIKEANLNNVLCALAGAFLLNAVHLPSLKGLYEIGIIEAYVESGGRIFKGKIDHINTLLPDDFKREYDKAEAAAYQLKPVRFAWWYMVETPLFTFKHPRDAVVEKLDEMSHQSERRGLG